MITRGWRGRFYEDFEIGAVYQHPLGRTVSDTDNTWFTLLTMNTNEAHFNAEVGKASEFGKPVVVSALTIAIGQSVTDTTRTPSRISEWTSWRSPIRWTPGTRCGRSS